MPLSKSPDLPVLKNQAADLATRWQQRANALLTPEEKAQQKKMRRLFSRPGDKVLLAKLMDQSFRSANHRRVADQVHHLLHTYGFPDFFNLYEKVLLQAFMDIGRHLPALSIPQIMSRIRHYAGALVISAEPQGLPRHLEKQKIRGVQVNINRLGEAVLGEEEARRRLEIYLKDLEDPSIEQMSIKISTIYSQVHPLAFEHDREVVSERLALLYRRAVRHPYIRTDGSTVAKMVHLDMESYADLELTVAAFRQTLSLPDLADCTAGIALQAYLPDSFTIQQELTRWARDRVAKGAAPIKIRIVKGANMAMEQIEAALSGWPLAPFDNKPDVDANYKRMVLYGLQPDNIGAVRLGIASHNLFDLAFALYAARSSNAEARIVFEMLTGMADGIRRVLVEEGFPVLLYTPVAAPDEFINAVAYLFRRLDENSGPDNFLHRALLQDPEAEPWQRLRQEFFDACRRMDRLRDHSHRIQNRLTGETGGFTASAAPAPFENVPNTDWSMAANRQWADRIRAKWHRLPGSEPTTIALVIAGRTICNDICAVDIIDPNQLPCQVLLARCSLAGPQDIAQAVAAGRADPDGWRSLPTDRRRTVLDRVAAALEEARADLIGAATAGTGKVFAEADAEVSEAVDLARYYPGSVAALERHPNLCIRGKGLGVVVSPWNFPIAIPCGGIMAALSAGNTVIFKPSSEALLPAWELCNVLWECGISRNTLQFVPCHGSTTGRQLIGHPDVNFVILTGGTSTALGMLAQRPDLFLAAETGGKNATIVTALADRDQAVKHVIYSAFGHSGQKCSATSLLILEKEVYDDPHFKAVLVDAARSLLVGSGWEFHNRMGPLIHPPEKVLKQAIERLEPGESWALRPTQKDNNPHLWTPGIKYGVQPGSFTHMTELFGPVLGVMRARNLKEAVTLANQTGYGLTAGLETLDDREIRQWSASIRAGNLYINRVTTGAITLRQPFGGMGQSAIGPGIKTGGPNYVTQFIDVTETGSPAVGTIGTAHRLLSLARHWQRQCRWGQMGALGPDLEKSATAIFSYLEWAQKEFLQVKDHFHLAGEDNRLKYLPVGTLGVCIHSDDSLFESLARIAAGLISGCKVVVSIPPRLDNGVIDFITGVQGRRLMENVDIHTRDEDQTAEMVIEMDRLRYASAQRVPKGVYAAAASAGRYIARAPVLMNGRLELLHYFVNQSISHAYHRYGNLGERGVG